MHNYTNGTRLIHIFSGWVGGTLGQQAAEKTAKELEMKIIKFS